MSGKGSRPRPMPDRAGFESNWDAIFGKKKDKEDKSKSPSGSQKKGK